jgi:hypothetical protein
LKTIFQIIAERTQQRFIGVWYYLPVAASILLQPGAPFLNREARRLFWEESGALGIPLWEAQFRKKKKPERSSRLSPQAHFSSL